MKILDVNSWNRKQHFEHFSKLADPYFGVTIPFDVDKAYRLCKDNNISFFAKYLHACFQAVNDIENLKFRIENNNVVVYDVIHASPTLMRDDKTYGFSFIEFDEDLNIFIKNIDLEKKRINTTKNLYPPVNGLNCVHCSALPWINFSGHKEPVSGLQDSVPKIAFSKATRIHEKLVMNVSINVNHALVDGYHIGLFSEKFQHYLNL